jgi:hypothetical protein
VLQGLVLRLVRLSWWAGSGCGFRKPIAIQLFAYHVGRAAMSAFGGKAIQSPDPFPLRVVSVGGDHDPLTVRGRR